jgi:aminoglycoside 9-adenylyltransferase
VTSKDGAMDLPTPDGVPQVVGVVRWSLGTSIVGAYLFGSSTVGGLKPQSDLDVLVVVREPVSDAARRKLVTELLKISGDGATNGQSRPIEVTVVNRSDIVPWRYPPKNELVYGEWLRPEFEAGRIPPPAFDPDLAVIITKVWANGIAVLGPSARDVLEPVPAEDLRRAIADSLPKLVGELRGDERNVLLTLARMWITLATDEIVPKDVAAEWVINRLPRRLRAVLDLARRAYIGECRDDWAHRQKEVDAFVQHAKQEILLLLKQNSSRIEHKNV